MKNGGVLLLFATTRGGGGRGCDRFDVIDCVRVNELNRCSWLSKSDVCLGSCFGDDVGDV